MEKQYVHSRLVVGDGFVTVTEGESMQNFFKHAEEVVKEVSRFYKARHIFAFGNKINLAYLFLAA